MSCGTKITGRFSDRHFERDELAEKLEAEGEWRLARSVRRGECLDNYELRKAERALSDKGLSSRFDYRKRECECEPGDE